MSAEPQTTIFPKLVPRVLSYPPYGARERELVSVIVVVGLANLSCRCDHCVNVANKADKKM